MPDEDGVMPGAIDAHLREGEVGRVLIHDFKEPAAPAATPDMGLLSCIGKAPRLPGPFFRLDLLPMGFEFVEADRLGRPAGGGDAALDRAEAPLEFAICFP